MSKTVEARFYLSTLTETKMSESETVTSEEGKPEQRWVEVPAISVRMGGVQGEPFGRYTPNADASMIIRQGAAAEVFRDAWRKYIDTPGAKSPKCRVLFIFEDEDQPV